MRPENSRKPPETGRDGPAHGTTQDRERFRTRLRRVHAAGWSAIPRPHEPVNRWIVP